MYVHPIMTAASKDHEGVHDQSTVEPLYKGHAGTMTLYTEVSFIQRLNYY